MSVEFNNINRKTGMQKIKYFFGGRKYGQNLIITDDIFLLSDSFVTINITGFL